MISLSSILIFFSFFSYFNQDIFSLSKGDNYYYKLRRWYFYVGNLNWQKASSLESELNLNDIAYYKSKYAPQSIIKRLDDLYRQNDFTIDDYLEIAKLEALMDNNKSAYSAIEKAYKLDPLRTDIEKIYFTFPR